MIGNKKDADVVSHVCSFKYTNNSACIPSTVGNEAKRWIWCAGRVVSCSLRVTRVPNWPFYLTEAQWPMHTIKTSEGIRWRVQPDVYIWGVFSKVWWTLDQELSRWLGDIFWLRPCSVTCCVLSLIGHSFSPHGGSTTSRNVNLIFLDCRQLSLMRM